MPAEVIALLLIAVMGLMALYAALHPEQYARYFLARWQRERISGRLNVLSWSGWGILALCIIAALIVVLRTRIQSYGAVLEAAMLLVFAIAWLWWGTSLLLRPQEFSRRTATNATVWVVRMFGGVLVLGAVFFGYQFSLKAWALLR
jgi:hypothetical protein